MKKKDSRTIVVVGGGYAGIHAIRALRDAAGGKGDGDRLRIVLVDRRPHHLRKVLLFKQAAGEADLAVPFETLFPAGVGFKQGGLTDVSAAERTVGIRLPDGREERLSYDALVLAVGSTVRRPDPESGGIALADPDAAVRIRETWRANVRRAAADPDAAERRRLLTAVVAGAGISGIETSAELAHALRGEAAAAGLNPDDVRVWLLNAGSRLFPEGPAKVGAKLERQLAAGGVRVRHGVNALREQDGTALLSDGRSLPAGLLVWTIGLQPNADAAGFGLPVTAEGQLRVDGSYRVENAPGVYSIGDCARIVDPATGTADRMTCKEAIAQANRLAKVMLADLAGEPAPVHRVHPEQYCFGLGPDRGLVWMRKWGLDFVIGGKLGWKIRKMTWETASMGTPV